MKTVAGLLVAVVCVVVGAGCGGGDEPGDLIAFSSDRDGDNEIFVMNSDGTEVRQLTDNDTYDGSPALSPDGKRIIFFSTLYRYHFFVMNVDGTKVHEFAEIDDHRMLDNYPSWSPDGEHIAFTRRIEGDHEVFVMKADGTEVRQLTDNDDSDYSPSWSPDGEHIAFESDRDGAWEVFVMAADGTEVRQLTDNEDDDGSPSWSPDGEHIAFQKLPPIEESSLSPSQQAEVARLQQEARDFPETAALNTLEMRRIRNNARLRSREVFVMNPDGTEVRQLTDNDDDDGSPSWSSDGEHIVFVGNRDGDAEIFVMNSDGTEVRQFTDFDDLDFVPSFSNLPTGPTWSPDGKRIAFQSDRYGDAEVFVMNADGTGVYSTGQKGGSPSWGG